MSAEASPEQEGFSVEIVHMDGNAVLRLHGDLELATVLRLRVAVAAVHARGIRELVLDLSALDFIDARGLRELVVARQRQQEIGGDVILHSPRPQTLRVLEDKGLERRVRWFESMGFRQPDPETTHCAHIGQLVESLTQP